MLSVKLPSMDDAYYLRCRSMYSKVCIAFWSL
uniref:Uncharacterized protein n=1 Tax=Anguilla anguilla TaxID=7936 RepID=A0A0E9W730_ANGAN